MLNKFYKINKILTCFNAVRPPFDSVGAVTVALSLVIVWIELEAEGTSSVGSYDERRVKDEKQFALHVLCQVVIKFKEQRSVHERTLVLRYLHLVNYAPVNSRSYLFLYRNLSNHVVETNWAFVEPNARCALLITMR